MSTPKDDSHPGPSATDPHRDGGIHRAGTPLEHASGALLLLHGRGGSASDILQLGQAIAPPGWALLAPQAAGNTWYPHSFLAPRAQNEPHLTSALRRVAQALQSLSPLPASRTVLAGFSQGACLASEFAGRHPQRFAAVLAFTGGLIGPLDEPIHLTGDLDGTPVLLSSGDPDPHVPWSRVEQTAQLLTTLGARVTTRRYPGRPHTVSPPELAEARTLLASLKAE